MTPVHAEPDSAEQMSQPIEISVKRAPINLFFKALFANTEIDVEVNESVDHSISISGRYKGSIASVLADVSKAYELSSLTSGRTVRITSGIMLDKVLSEQPYKKAQKAPTQTRAEEQAIGNTVKPFTSEVPDVVRIKSKPKLSTIAAQRNDAIVEKVFVLVNAKAGDTSLNDARQTRIPGVATRLKLLVPNLGGVEIAGEGRAFSEVIRFHGQVTVLPTMNAIIIKDLASRMALYDELIRSLDRVEDIRAENASPTWSIVQ